MAMGRVVVSMTMEVCTYKTVLITQYQAKKRLGMCKRVMNAKNKSKKKKKNPYCCNCMIMLSNETKYKSKEKRD